MSNEITVTVQTRILLNLKIRPVSHKIPIKIFVKRQQTFQLNDKDPHHNAHFVLIFSFNVGYILSKEKTE